MGKTSWYKGWKNLEERGKVKQWNGKMTKNWMPKKKTRKA